MKLDKLPEGYNSIDITPPDELVRVIDENENIANAYPTWYPFKVVPSKTKTGKFTSDIVPCEPYWDGGWMVECIMINTNIGHIIGWRKLDESK